MKRLLVVGMVALLPTAAVAGHCRVSVRSRAVVRSQVVQELVPIPVQQVYQVGESVQEDALAERIAARVLAKLEAQTAAQATAATTLVQQHCSKCHSGGPEAAKGGIDLTGDLDCETRLHAIRMLLANDPARRMPKGKELDPQVLGDLIGELAGVETLAR